MLDEVEQKELEDQLGNLKKDKKLGKKKVAKVETMPSPHGIRVIPKISDELKKKALLALATKEKKAAKTAFGKSLSAKMAEFDEPDEFDDMADDKEHNRSLSDRLGFNIKAEEKPKKAAKMKKERSDTVKTKKNEKQHKTPWESASDRSDSDSRYSLPGSGSDAESEMGKFGPPARDRPGRERKTIKYKFDDSSNTDDSMKDNRAIQSPPRNGHASKPATDSEDSDKQEIRQNIKVNVSPCI